MSQVTMNNSFIPDLKICIGTMITGSVFTYVTPENVTFTLEILSQLAQIACYSIGAIAGIKAFFKLKPKK